MKITLTFDNGPTEVTPSVLDTLHKHSVKAAFFVLGQQVADPTLYAHTARAYDEGHRIGNHTYSHGTPFGLVANPQDAIDEIASTQRLIDILTGPGKLFRPTGGGGHIDERLLSPGVVDYLARERFTMALWNCVPRDWDDPDGWVARAFDDCLRLDWTVCVLHDLASTGAMAHLDRFLGMLRDHGATFTQELPAALTPIVQGQCVGDLQALTTGPIVPAVI